jgi:hypothetical protein
VKVQHAATDQVLHSIDDRECPIGVPLKTVNIVCGRVDETDLSNIPRHEPTIRSQSFPGELVLVEVSMQCQLRPSHQGNAKDLSRWQG